MEDVKPGFRNSLNVKEEAGFNLFNTLELWKDIRYPNVSCDDHFPLSDVVRRGREGDTTRSSHMCCEGAEGGNTCQDCRDGNTPVDHSLVNKPGFAFPSVLYCIGQGRKEGSDCPSEPSRTRCRPPGGLCLVLGAVGCCADLQRLRMLKGTTSETNGP